MHDPLEQVDPLLRRLEQLQGQRKNWDTHWQEIMELVWPDAGDFIGQRTSGEKRAHKVYDPTAALSLEKFASAIESLTTPRATTWHRLKTTQEELNEDASVKEWFETVNQMLFDHRSAPRSNFYSQMHEGNKSLGAFGNRCMFVDDHPKGGIRYLGRFIGDVFTDINHDGIIDTIFYKYKMSAKAAFQKWGDMIGPRAKAALAEKPFDMQEYLHVVLPRIEIDFDRIDAPGMPWESFDISMEDRHMIDTGGYHELPYLYSRYTVNPDERYGRGPIMLVLPAIKTLQEMEKSHIRAGHKVADPPLLLHDDGVIGTGSSKPNLRPGGLNYGGLDMQGRELIKPLITGARVDITQEMMQSKRQAINEALLVSLFQILEEKPGNMTATEVLERAKEKGILLAPMIGRQQSEMLGPLVEREINILQRQGRLPELPEALKEADGEYRIEYESMATNLQKSEVIMAIMQTTEVMTPFAQTNPGAFDIFNTDEIARIVAGAGNVPLKALRSEEELNELREAQQEQARAQAQAEAAPQIAGALKDTVAAEATARETQAAG